ncbi:transglycosylase SLT domain-containing protein [Amycolatopsis minnesotensis]|uniref:Transglycosylase SLT domain-containing protein n=1 Tax=Amycolatopsis minnesotensis TaxID=337894 RepID=A0ABP5BYG8_9PSEU
MTVLDEVAALPGGSAVAELARQLDAATPDTALSIADAWHEVSTVCADLGGTLGKPAGELNHDLRGKFADAFEDYARTFGQAGSTLSRALAEASGAVRAAATRLANTKTWQKTRCEGLLNAAKAAGNRRDADAAIRALCAEAATDIRQAITTCTAELGTALTSLQRAAEGGKALTELSDPAHPPAVFTMPVATIASAPTPTPVISLQSPPPPSTKPVEPVVTKPVEQKPPANESARSHGTSEHPVRHVSTSSGSPGSHHPVTTSGGPSGPPPSGEVADWMREALSILSANGVDVSGIDPAQLYAIIQHESGGNPHAINDWDSNAAAGHPSKGLMQTIDSTFGAYRLDGHEDIWNPVDNIIAAVRYAIARYGSISEVPGIAAMTSGGGYVGY